MKQQRVIKVLTIYLTITAFLSFLLIGFLFIDRLLVEADIESVEVSRGYWREEAIKYHDFYRDATDKLEELEKDNDKLTRKVAVYEHSSNSYLDPSVVMRDSIY